MITWLKSLSRMTHSRASSWFLGLPRGRVDYGREVGQGLTSSAIMGVVQWMQRAFPEAPLVVQRRKGTELQVIEGHALPQLIAQPNGAYAGEALWMATVWSWCIAGNAYWIVVRERGGRPRELWYTPHWLIEPKWPTDGSAFISHYEYKPDGQVIRLDPGDVVHFRHGIHPEQPRLGLSPLDSVLREVWMDDEASRFVAALLKNSAVPSVILSPKQDNALSVDLSAVKEYLAEQFTGDRRGSPMALGGPTDVHQLGYNPEQLDLSVVRDTAEERVCACLGIQPSVIGFGTGIRQTRVGATMREQVGLSWSNGLVPIQRIMAGELARSLLPGFQSQAERYQVGWDYSRVLALQEDETAKAQRYDVMVRGGWLMVSEAREAMGMRSTPADHVYLRPIAAMEVGPGARPLERLSTIPLNGNGNGNGNAAVGDDAAVADDGKHAVTDGNGLKQLPGDLLTSLIAQTRPRVSRIPPALARLATRLERESPRLQQAFAGELVEVFDRLGRMAARAAEQVLGGKAEAQDLMDAARIAEGMALRDLLPIFERVYGYHYSRVAISTFTAIGESLGLETDIPDPVMRAIVATGGRRLGLLDLPTQVKQSLFEALTEGRAAGEGVDTLVRRIRDQIPAGPWRDSATRARVIARTETKYSQNLSTIHRARDVDQVQHMLVFDARLGDTDAECALLNGQIVTLEESRVLADSEHPNGTRSFSPVPAALLAEMGVTV